MLSAISVSRENRSLPSTKWVKLEVNLTLFPGEVMINALNVKFVTSPDNEFGLAGASVYQDLQNDQRIFP